MVAIVNNPQFTGVNPQGKPVPATKEYKGVEQHPSALGISHKPDMPKDAVQVSAEGRFVAAVAEFEKSVLQLRQDERAKAKARNAVVLPMFIDDEREAQSFEITVTQLATAQVLESAKFADAKADVGCGTLTFGSADGAFNIPVRGGLHELVERINKAEDNFGVSAALHSNDEGVSLIVQANRTGAGSAFTISAESQHGQYGSTSLTQLCFNATGSSGFWQINPAQNASYAIEGRHYTSESNIIEYCGVTFELVERGVTRVDLVPPRAQSLDEFATTFKISLRRVLDEVGNRGQKDRILQSLIAELRHRLKLESNDVSGLLESGIVKQKGNRYGLDVSVLREAVAPVMRAVVQANGDAADSPVAESASLQQLLADNLTSMAQGYHDKKNRVDLPGASSHGISTSNEARAKHYSDVHKVKP